MIKHSAKDNRNQRESTETEQKLEKKEESPYRDGDDEPNEILRHILTEYPGANKAVDQMRARIP